LLHGWFSRFCLSGSVKRKADVPAAAAAMSATVLGSHIPHNKKTGNFYFGADESVIGRLSFHDSDKLHLHFT
jgi:hypothetical protein